MSDDCPEIDIINSRDSSGKSPLMIAVANGADPEIVSSLLKKGAGIEALDGDGKSIIDKLSQRLNTLKSKEVMLRLISYGAIEEHISYNLPANEVVSILKKDPTLVTPKLAKTEQKFAGTAPSMKGYPLLRIVASCIAGDGKDNSFDIFRLLIENGADFKKVFYDGTNIISGTGMMLFIEADEDKHYSKIIIPLLIAYGADTKNIIPGSVLEELNSTKEEENLTKKRVLCYVASIIRDGVQNSIEKKEMLDYVFEEKNLEALVGKFEGHLVGLDMSAILFPRDELCELEYVKTALLPLLKDLIAQPRADSIIPLVAESLGGSSRGAMRAGAGAHA